MHGGSQINLISDLSAKTENLCSSEKELQKIIKETATTLS